MTVEIFVTDSDGDRNLIKDLYWFEANGVHSFDEAVGFFGEKYEFKIFVDGYKVYPSIGFFDVLKKLPRLLPESDLSKWVCQDCFEKFDGKYECSIDGNLSQEKCCYCEKEIGRHYLIGLPEKL